MNLIMISLIFTGMMIRMRGKSSPIGRTFQVIFRLVNYCNACQIMNGITLIEDLAVNGRVDSLPAMNDREWTYIYIYIYMEIELDIKWTFKWGCYHSGISIPDFSITWLYVDSLPAAIGYDNL